MVSYEHGRRVDGCCSVPGCVVSDRGLYAAEGTLVIRFSIVDGRQTNAVEAVDNLKRRLLPDSRRRRRNADATIPLLRSEVNNRTITPTQIHNWTGAAV